MKTWTIDDDGWVRGPIFGFEVEIRPMPRPGGAPYIPLDPARANKVNPHTTEGAMPTDPDDIMDAWSFLKGESIGCWLIGEDRMIQGRPLGFQCSALRTPADGSYFPNADFIIEYEKVANSQTKLWLPGDDVVEPEAALLAFAALEFGVELRKARDDWPDDRSDIPLPWAVPDHARRKWVASVGLKNIRSCVIPHVDIPYTNTHWDDGAYRSTEVFAMARQLLEEPEPPPPPPPNEEDIMAQLTEGELADLRGSLAFTKGQRKRLRNELPEQTPKFTRPDYDAAATTSQKNLARDEMAGWDQADRDLGT